ncbi:F-box and WD-40 domain protein 1/11 [Entomortierella parvispora]|uniref:F-box and WD-40 domain protein 1/11 n=1 Tax=Entomortierella parvispora TaxID=205924 RepID=A0A9P3H534_9FUNG|nr:F-box and WD-40 domain protein 1/11 [Entomortierella parvispora]
MSHSSSPSHPDSPSPSLPDEGYDEHRIDIPKWVHGWSDEQRAELAIQLLKSVSPSVFSRSFMRLTPLFQFRDFLVLLPYELAIHVLSFLDAETLSRVALVSKAWYKFACDNSIWKRIYFAQGWTVNQDMVDWYLRSSELQVSWVLRQEQERHRDRVHFETESSVKSGKRKMMEIDMLEVDDDITYELSPRRAPSTTAQYGSEDERFCSGYGQGSSSEFIGSPLSDPSEDVVMAHSSEGDDPELSASIPGLCISSRSYVSISPEESPSLPMDPQFGASSSTADTSSSASQRHGRFSLSNAPFIPSLYRPRMSIPMYISNPRLAPPSLRRKISQRTNPPAALRLPNIFTGGASSSPGQLSAGPTRFFSHRRSNSMDPPKSESQPTSPTTPSIPTTPHLSSSSPAGGSLPPGSSKSLWNVIRHGVMGVSGSAAWPYLHSHRNMSGDDTDSPSRSPNTSASSSPTFQHHHHHHHHHNHPSSLAGWLMHLPSPLSPSKHHRSASSPPRSPILRSFHHFTPLDDVSTSEMKIPAMPRRMEYSRMDTPSPLKLLSPATIAIHQDPSTGRPTINWKYLCQQRTILERNWNSGIHTARELPGHSEGIYCVQFDDHKIVSGSRDNTIKIWDLDSGICARTLSGHSASVLCLHYEGNRIVSGSSDTNIMVWDMESGSVVKTLTGHSESVLSLRFENDTVVSCSKDQTVRIWSISTGKMIRMLVGHVAAVNAVQFSPEISSDPASSAEESNLRAPRFPDNVRIVVSASGDKTIRVWSFDTGECLRTLYGHARGIACIQLEGNCVISGSSDRTIKVWDIAKNECVHTLTGHESLVRTLQFSKEKIISGSYDQSIKIWDRATGNKLADLEGRHSHRVFKLQFNDSKIVSCSQDQKIIVWDFAVGVDMTFMS